VTASADLQVNTPQEPRGGGARMALLPGTVANASVSNNWVIFMSITGLDLRSVWLSLSPINKTFLLFFGAVSVHTLSFSARALLFLRSLKKQPANENASSTHPRLNIHCKRVANLRQLHLFTLYLFGFCISIQVPNAFITLGNSNALAVSTIMRQLTFLFYCDATIFLAFLLLHTLQWLVSARVHSFATGKAE